MSSQFVAQSRITVSLPSSLLKFLLNFSKRSKRSKSAVVQEALLVLRERELGDELREAALANAERNVQFAEEDMGDFLDIIACNGDSDGWWE